MESLNCNLIDVISHFIMHEFTKVYDFKLVPCEMHYFLIFTMNYDHDWMKNLCIF